jgi:hypothetical protein
MKLKIHQHRRTNIRVVFAAAGTDQEYRSSPLCAARCCYSLTVSEALPGTADWRVESWWAGVCAATSARAIVRPVPASSIVWLMTGSVSVPEKTLEHWSSQYITYRYRSWAGQWWPASGDDIDVRWVPGRPGKVVRLELKTTKVVGPGIHQVDIDLGQLWDYHHRPLGLQPFYAFPWPGPDWSGDLTTAASSHGRAVADLGYSRSGSGWWFADWMVVLTTAEVAGVLSADLASHGSGKRGQRRPLVRFDHSRFKPTWGSGTTAPDTIRWLDFWKELERCGRPGWPQLIRLPAWLARPGTRYHPSDVTVLLREASGSAGYGEANRVEETFVTVSPEPDGTYFELPAPADGLSLGSAQVADNADSSANHSEDHLQMVFLDSQALLKDS